MLIIKQFNGGIKIGDQYLLVSFKINSDWNCAIVAKKYDRRLRSEIKVVTPNYITMPINDWMYP